MGRATQFLDYLNRDPGDFDQYYPYLITHLTIHPRLKEVRREYRKHLKALKE